MSSSIQSQTLVILQTYSTCASPVLQPPSPASHPAISQCAWILGDGLYPFAYRYTTHKPPLRPVHTNASLLRLIYAQLYRSPFDIPALFISLSPPLRRLLGHPPFSLDLLSTDFAEGLIIKRNASQNGVQGGKGEELDFP